MIVKDIPIDLLDYAKKIADNPLLYVCPIGRDVPTLVHDTVATAVVHREGQFQTEVVVSKPGAPAWPGEHLHPDVDSIEIGVYNTGALTRHGEEVTEADFIYNGFPFVYLDHTCLHGAPYKERGFLILSVQKWLNGVTPSSVGLNWHGEPVHPSHAKQQQENS